MIVSAPGKAASDLYDNTRLAPARISEALTNDVNAVYTAGDAKYGARLFRNVVAVGAL